MRQRGSSGRGSAAVRALALAALPLWWAAPTAAQESLSGSLRSAGSDTLAPLVQRWAEELRRAHPGLGVEVESLGSATAPAALSSGQSQLAPMSRRMTEDEADAYEEAVGHEPVAVRVALDALAVYVHADNPLRGLTLEQIDGIFSSTRECGGDDVTRWGDLVLGALKDRPIALYGRDEVSGTHAHFREEALCGGAFRDSVREMPDSAAVMEAVGSSVDAIGYAGIGFRGDGVRPIAIAEEEDDPYFTYVVERHREDPDPSKRYGYVVDGRYPLSRYLYVYVRKAPDERLPAPVEAFLELALSPAGQRIVEEEGFVPLPAKRLERERRKLEASYRPRWWRRD